MTVDTQVSLNRKMRAGRDIAGHTYMSVFTNTECVRDISKMLPKQQYNFAMHRTKNDQSQHSHSWHKFFFKKEKFGENVGHLFIGRHVPKFENTCLEQFPNKMVPHVDVLGPLVELGILD